MPKILPNGVVVAGRGLRAPVLDVVNGGAGVTLRVDDDEQPEFWLEIKVPTDVLRAWYLNQLGAEVRAARAESLTDGE